MENHLSECLARRNAAALELRGQQPDLQTEEITHHLVYGLNTLKSLMFKRIHDDVEASLGTDSMLLPVSLDEGEKLAKQEIEAYQTAVSTLITQQRGYVSVDLRWYVRWLGRLRLCEAMQQDKWRRRVRKYLRMDEDQQRLAFSRNLEHVFPEATRAPLILYRLFPLAIQIVTSVAFGDHLWAAELRNRQMFWLPEIGDCHECHGRPLDNGDQCGVCGNPLWNFNWLEAVN